MDSMRAACGFGSPGRRAVIDAAFRAADEGFAQQVMKWKFNGKDAGNGWNRSVNNSQWGLRGAVHG